MHFHTSTTHLNGTFVVSCKRCDKVIPSRTNRLPDQAVLVVCPLCSEKRQYLPTEIFQGKPCYEILKLKSQA